MAWNFFLWILWRKSDRLLKWFIALYFYVNIFSHFIVTLNHEKGGSLVDAQRWSSFSAV